MNAFSFACCNWLCLPLQPGSLLFSKCFQFPISMTIHGAALFHFYRFINDANENKLAEIRQ